MRPHGSLGEIQILWRRAVAEWLPEQMDWQNVAKNLPTGRLRMLFKLQKIALMPFSHVCPQKLDPKRDSLRKYQILKL
jgi:hypothetical protein